MNSEDISNNRGCNMIPSKSKTEMNEKEQPPKTSSMEDNRKKLASVHEKIYYVDSARSALLLCVAFLCIFAIFNLWQPMKVMGMRLCYVLLISHSLSFLGFGIIHYHFLPPLVDESNSLGRQIKESKYCKPAYHPSKTDMFGYYLKILIALLTNAGIWIKLTSMDFPYDSIPSIAVADTCGYLGLLLTAVSIYVVASMGPVVTRVDTEMQKTAQATVMSEKDAFYNQVLREEEEVSLEQDKILQEKDARYFQLLQAKDLVSEEKERVIQAKDLVLEEKERVIQAKDLVLEEKERVLQEKEARYCQVLEEKGIVSQAKDLVLEEREKELQAKDLVLEEKERVLQEKEARYCQVLEEKGMVSEAKDLVLEEREKELQEKNEVLQQSKGIIVELLHEKTDENKRK